MLEDIATDAVLAERTLSSAGIEFVAKRVETREAFLQGIREFNPDVVLADYSLPKMTGLEALRLMQQERAELPFILVTGTQNEEVAVDCMKAGADDYILKTSLMRLPSALLNALKKRQTEREKVRAQAVLSESEAQFRTLLHNIDEIVWIQDYSSQGPAGQLRFISNQSKNILGYSPEEFLRDPGLFRSLIHPSDAACFEEFTRRVIERKESVTHAYRLRQKLKAEYRWVEDKVTPQLDDKGDVVGMFGVARDITERHLAEETIRQSEEMNRRILETVPGGIVLVSRDGSIMQANSEAQRILGLSYDQLQRMFISDFRYRTIYEDGRDYPVEEYPVAKCLKTGLPQPAATLGVIRPDGSISWGIFTAAPVNDLKTGELSGAVVTFLDITPRKRAEEALRESEDRFRSAFGHAPIGMALVSNDGKFIQVNQSLCKMLGYSEQELLARNFQSVSYPDELPKSMEMLKKLLSGETTSGRLEKRYVHKNGGLVWAEVRISTIQDSAGRPSYFISQYQDITEQKEAEEALRESRERFTAFMDNNPSVAWMKDENWRFVYINKAFAQCFSVTADSIIGKTDYDFFSKSVSDELRRNDESVIRSGRVLQTFETVPTPDNKPHHWLVLKFPFQDASRHKYVGGIGIDVTERKRAEEDRLALERKMLETQKLESLGVLAGGIAHDFNNLLAAVLGNVSLATMQMPPESTARPYLASIETTTHRAAELCKQMLAYAGKGRFTVQPLNLNQIIHEMAELLRISIGKRTTLKLDLAQELPMFPADATQIRQVVMNLIINASEAIGDQGGIISMSTSVMHVDGSDPSERDLAEGEHIFLEVADTGCGMDAQTKAKIFDPFFTTKFTGRGLGLAAVLGIVRGHRGVIKVESEVGKGTRFKILFPCDKAAQPAPALAPSRPSNARTILVVDGSDTLRALQTRMLETLGYGAASASNGEQALEAIRARPEISAVLLDLSLPGLSSEDVCVRIARIRPELPVIFVGGIEQQFPEESGERVSFLRKPFTTAQLDSALSAVLT